MDRLEGDVLGRANESRRYMDKFIMVGLNRHCEARPCMLPRRFSAGLRWSPGAEAPG